MLAVRAQRVATVEGERHGWWVTFDESGVLDVGPEPPARAERRDLGAVDLLPGLIDLHSDCMERHLRPRQDSVEPIAAAVLHADAEAAAHGVTTSYLCAAFEEDSSRDRSNQRAAELVQTLDAWRGHLRVEHRAHLRAELADVDADIFGREAARPVVGLVSYMDHTPGQGMWIDVHDWRAMKQSNYGTAQQDVLAAEARMVAAGSEVPHRRVAVARLAASVGVPLAAHDLDGEDMLRTAVADGVAIAEFPLSLEAAERSRAAGLGIVMGAPNARRGGSRLNRLSARDAIAAGAIDALTSDYHVPSMVGAVYQLVADGVCSWSDAVALVTSGPARIAGLEDRGRLEPGLRADVIAVSVRDGLPRVRQAWTNGRTVWN